MEHNWALGQELDAHWVNIFVGMEAQVCLMRGRGTRRVSNAADWMKYVTYAGLDGKDGRIRRVGYESKTLFQIFRWKSPRLYLRSTSKSWSDFHFFFLRKTNRLAPGAQLGNTLKAASTGIWAGRLTASGHTHLHRERGDDGGEGQRSGQCAAITLLVCCTGWVLWVVPWVLLHDGSCARCPANLAIVTASTL